MSVDMTAAPPTACPPSITSLRDQMFQRLAAQKILAWDFDDTLVGHAASEVMQGFIAANPQTTHLIVTFRSKGSEPTIWRDLATHSTLIGPDHFTHTITIDRHLAETVQRLRRMRAQRLYAGPEAPAERAYRHWKGMICAQLGAAVLIDDRTDDVLPGCDAFGIALLHPDAFL